MLTVLDVAGDARACGYSQGDAFRSRFGEMRAALGALPLGPPWLAPLRRVAVRLAVPTLGHLHWPRHREGLAALDEGRPLARVEALAAGFGVPVTTLWGMHAFEVESADLGFTLGCTALALTAEATEAEAPLLAYNHDFPVEFSPFLFVRRTRPTGRLASLAISYQPNAGCLTGLNEAGLALSVNQAFVRAVERRRATVLPTLLLQACLERCRTVAEAVTLISAAELPVGGLITLLDAAGGAAVVEVAPGARAIRRDGALTRSFNQYRVASMLPHEIPVGARGTGLAAGFDIHACNLTRERRFAALRETKSGRWSIDVIKAVLADHDAGVGDADSICRHDESVGGSTIASVILEPAARRMHVCLGWPCRGSYEPVEL